MSNNFESTIPADKHSATEPIKPQISDKFHIDAYDKHPTKTTEFKFFDEGIPLNVPYSQQKREIESLYPTLSGRGTQTADNYLKLIDADQKYSKPQAGADQALPGAQGAADQPPVSGSDPVAGDSAGAHELGAMAAKASSPSELDIRDLGKIPLQHWKEMDKGDKGYITAEDVKSLLKNPKIKGLERSTLEYVANNPGAISEASNDSIKEETSGRIYLRDFYRFFSDTNPRPDFVTDAISDDLRAHQKPKAKTGDSHSAAPSAPPADSTLPPLTLVGENALPKVMTAAEAAKTVGRSRLFH